MQLSQPLLDAAIKAACRLVDAGRTLLEGLAGARATGITTYLPRRFRNDPARAERRIARTMEWVDALTETLIGSGLYLLRPRKPSTRPPPTPPPRPTIRTTPSNTPEAEARRAASRRRTIRRAFATTPTNIIAKRLANRMGISPNSDGWPKPIFEITETPAQWAAAVRAVQPKAILRAWKQSERIVIRRRAAAAIAPPQPTQDQGLRPRTPTGAWRPQTPIP